MLVLSLLPILISISASAFPSRRDGVPASALLLPSGQQQLVAPADPPSFVVLGVGFQNYTCQAGNWTSSGAVANLFDITGLYSTDEFSKIQQSAHDDWVAFQSKDGLDPTFAQNIEGKYSVKLSGQHYHKSSGGVLSPVWDFTSSGPTAGNADAIVVGNVTGTIKAPTAGSDIDWLQLGGVSGKLAKTIFRVNTVGGKAVSESCQGPDDSAKYTAVYWLYGSQL